MSQHIVPHARCHHAVCLHGEPLHQQVLAAGVTIHALRTITMRTSSNLRSALEAPAVQHGGSCVGVVHICSDVGAVAGTEVSV